MQRETDTGTGPAHFAASKLAVVAPPLPSSARYTRLLIPHQKSFFAFALRSFFRTEQELAHSLASWLAGAVRATLLSL